MKVRSLRSSKKKQRLQIAVVSLLLVGCGMLLPWLIATVSAVVLYPVHVTNQWLNNSAGLIPTFFRDRQSLHEEIAGLENQLFEAQRSTNSFNRLIEENSQLRQALGVEGAERLVAAVIARPNELPYDLVQIDRGSDHGIEVGAPVFVGKDAVIGLVVHTMPKYSFVELCTSPGFTATVFVSGPNVVATMEGMGGGVARVRVPQGILIQEGNLVHLPSIEPGVFGRIAHLENEPSQPEQYGFITPDVAMSGLHLVTVGQLSQISKSPTEIESSIREQIRQSLVLPALQIENASTTLATSTEMELHQEL